MHDERVVIKTRFSAFFQTELESKLEDLGPQEIGIAGYALDACVRVTAIDPYNRHIPFTIIEDCVLPERSAPPDAVGYLTWLTNCRVQSSLAWTSKSG